MPLSINDSFELKAQRYLDSRQGKLSGGKSEPYDAPEDILSAVPETRRVNGFPFYVKGEGDTPDRYFLMKIDGVWTCVKENKTGGG